MKAETLSMVHVEQLAEGANPKYVEGLREWDYEEVITELARDNLAAERAMKQANQAVLAVSETIQKLVAENAAMRKAINETIGWQESVDASNTESVRLLVAIQTPATDEFTAELLVQGVGQFAADMWKRGNELVAESAQKSLVVQVRLAAKLADTYVDNLRAGRKG